MVLQRRRAPSREAPGVSCAPVLIGLVLCCVPGSVGQAREQGDVPELFEHVDAALVDVTEAQGKILSQLREERTAAEVQIVRLDQDAFQAEAMALNVNPELTLRADRSRINESPDRGFTWSGTVGEAPAGARFYCRDQTVNGTFKTAEASYNLRPLGGGLHALIRRDPSKVLEDEPKDFEEVEREADQKQAPEPPDNLAERAPSDEDASDASPALVRMLVLHTPAVTDNHQDMAVFIDGLIAITNETYRDSDVPVRLELAHAAEVDYAESGSLATDVRRLRLTDDGRIDAIHALRDDHEADVVVMLIESGDAFGYAAAILADETTAFAVVDDEVADWYFTFAHEIGHLFGARHNPEADPSTSPFPHGHGLRNDPRAWRTIMSYACPGGGCDRLGLWSSPMIHFPPSGGDPAGTTDSNDNARVLRETAAAVSAFR